MSLYEVFHQFTTDLQHTSLPEYIAVIAGILSVWYSRIENVWVYPTGLLNTIIYIWLSFKGGLFGEASVNFYYTVMSIYGWTLWTRKDRQQHPILHITRSSARDRVFQLSFFGLIYCGIFLSLTFLKAEFAPMAIPWADAFASATAFTGMWGMAKKKAESWYWWIATNLASIPLYFVKHYVFTSVYYIILLVMAVFGLAEWLKRVKRYKGVNGSPHAA